MNTPSSTPTSAPSKTPKKDPLQRLSSAVRTLDQLINRAHQLESFTEQLLREDHTGPRPSSSESHHTQPVSPRSISKLLDKGEES